ncbi:hypothetical protein [Salegentibacter salarius]|uniref:Uncharacterized protein n=1 Tax=Salegentibacter salarius TaxID=435906 RepID=A0A2N0TNM0_9FLAO|nr:hypothetical protein [Salegentibacter salarius]OEY71533.1 hypothetical protein BHS39_05225 [Salegentibacter salarius]PKD16322.1 hypothetical protein APR40_05225 [Salegentibacter salarius]SLJ90086.1 hypothetical protein SAMN05660445_00937 [Salegentibacter salarius]
MNKLLLSTILTVLSFTASVSQERSVKIDFESGTFYNNPKVPFDESLTIVGETGKDIELVKVNIFYEDKDYILDSYVWNRIESNTSETFNIVIPPVLKSNTKYDFEIITYKLLNRAQKNKLLSNLENRIRFLLMNNIYFDGKNVVVNKPKNVFNELEDLIHESLKYQESKSLIPIEAPSSLVLQELKKQSDFKFNRLFKQSNRDEKNELTNQLIAKKVDHLVALISSELAPFFNSELVQHHKQVNIKSVKTDKEVFTLPINFGMYAWSKTVDINNTSAENVDFTPGIGLTIPFNNKSRLATKSRVLDSFGFSAGVLLEPVVDAEGTEYVTPGIDLPLYTGLGFRFFKVARFNAGVLIIGEKGTQDFNNLSILPTAGLALELDLWLGIKK